MLVARRASSYWIAALLLAACAAPSAPSASAPVSGAAASQPAAQAPPAAAPTALPRENVKAMYVALGMNSAPFWVAKDAGLFEAQGLDVELTYVAGAVQPAQALTAGDAYFS